ncbi:MAG: CoA activase, partial [Proteobacteria bacterium]|nr:CoA activase [Pseudomonadota bacterium]
MSIREENRLVDPEGLYAGIDAGSVSLNCIVINEEKQILYEAPYERHFGKVEEGVLDLIYSLYNRFGEERIRSVSFTGNHGKNLSERLGAFYEFETISQVLGAICVRPDVRTIISMGGQDTALFQVNHLSTGDLSGQGAWELAYFNSNGPCASGTGSFIDQQAQRLATSIYSKEADISRDQIDRILVDFIRLGIKSKRPANVACRCTVFTKSDMIHLQNRGERLEDIIYGLHVGNARNYMSTIVSNRALEEPILFVGGLSLNELQVKAFQAYFPGLIVPSHSTSIGALGVALEALDLVKEGRKPEIGRVDVGLLKGAPSSRRDALPVAPMLVLKETAFP